MLILPYERLTIETTLSIEEARRRLADAIEPKRMMRWGWSTSAKPFEGAITGDRFEMSRIIRYRNSFLPQISGQIRQGYQGAAIDLTLQLHLLVLIFMAVWLAGVGGAALLFIGTALGGGSFQPFSLIPVGMLVFFVLLSTLAFNFEASKAKALLNQLFA
jgi:hypothetical protein